MEEWGAAHQELNFTNGSDFYERNLSVPLERTSLSEPDAAVSRGMGPQRDPEAVRLQTTLLWMQMYASPLIFCAGIPLNLLSLAVVVRGSLRKTSLLQYVCALLIADVTLLANLFMMWLTQRGFDLYRLGALCHFTSFLSHTSSFLSLWISVGLAVDGYIRVCFPHAAPSLCTSIRARVVLLCLAACATAVYLNISLMVGVVLTPNGHICAPVNRYIRTLQILLRTDIFINVILPYCGLMYLMTHTAVVTLAHCCRTHRGVHTEARGERRLPLNMASDSDRVKQTGSDSSANTGNPSVPTVGDFACVCLCVIFFTLCLNLPSAVFRTFNTFLQILYPQRPMVVTQFLWQQLLQYPYYMKSACNFLILLAASRDFRRTAAALPVRAVTGLAHRMCRRSGGSSSGRERVAIEADPEDPDS